MRPLDMVPPPKMRRDGNMLARRPRVISSNAVRTFIHGGGKLRYEPVDDGGGERRRWELIAVTPEGEQLPVVVARTGEPRVFLSANAVVAYHEQMFPDAEGVFIPLKAEAASDLA
jgi:hypothetical protein